MGSEMQYKQRNSDLAQGFKSCCVTYSEDQSPKDIYQKN